MKKIISLILAIMMIGAVSAAFAKTVEPDDTEIERLAGQTFHATVAGYDEDSKTFGVIVFDVDRFDDDDVANLAVGDILLAGGKVHRISGQDIVDGTVVFRCEDGEEISFVPSKDGDDDLIARSTLDDRVFMHAVAALRLPVSEGIVLEDNSVPDADAEPIVTTGIEGILKILAEKEETSIGFDSYATTVTLNGDLEIVLIHQDFDSAQ